MNVSNFVLYSHATLGRLILLVAALVCGLDAPLHASPPPSPPPTERLDPRALEILRRMGDAYARLGELEQETYVKYEAIPLTPPAASPPTAPDKDRKSGALSGSQVAAASAGQPVVTEERTPRMRLSLQRPNRFRLEIASTTPGAAVPSQWVSDGRTFYVYRSEKGYYSKKKAPGRMSDFLKLPELDAGCIELVLAMGYNPFLNLADEVDSLRWTGEETIADSRADTVEIGISTATTRSKVRLSIGRADGMLYRIVSESTPVDTGRTPGKIGDALDELFDQKPLPQTPNSSDGPEALMQDDSDGPGSVSRIKTIVTLENKIVPRPHLVADQFAFNTPAGALLYEPIDFAHRKSPQRRGSYLRDLVRQLRKNGVIAVQQNN